MNRCLRPLFEPPPPSDITPRAVFDQRRALLAGVAGLALAGCDERPARAADVAPPRQEPLPGVRSAVSGALTMDKPTAREDATGYNNFYEFGPDKGDPARLAGAMKIRPWTVQVDGEVRRPKTWDIDALLKLAPLEERIYRLRCVEGWAMVIPWVGWSLAELVRQAEPTGNARFVEFHTVADKQAMPYVAAGRLLDWPYVEALRLDEALHPLTLLAFGMYGQTLPNQNGAPLRLVVPWKYGYKSGKSIVRIRFVEHQPVTSWVKVAPQEYGFYANVNPGVDHPRWSQASERRIGDGGLFAPRRPTLMFNGYASQVGQLYAGMDLARHF